MATRIRPAPRSDTPRTTPEEPLNVLDISLRNELVEVDQVAEAVEGFAREHGFTAPVCMAVSLSLHEHLTNVVTHGSEPGRQHAIQVHLAVANRQVEVEVRDDGRPFDPLSRPDPDTSLPLDEKPVGGLGVFLLRRLMDGVDYRHEDGLNVLRMTKRLG